MVTQDDAALARAIYDAFNQGAFERALQHASEDVEVVFIPTGQRFQGHQGFLEFMRGHRAAFPDIRIEVTNQIVADGHVVNELVAQGTHTGPLVTPAGAIAPTGRRATFTVCEVWQVREGKLTSLHNYQDMVSLLRQLGLIGEPAPVQA